MRPWTLRRIATRTLENPRRIPFGFVRRPARSTTTPVGPGLLDELLGLPPVGEVEVVHPGAVGLRALQGDLDRAAVVGEATREPLRELRVVAPRPPDAVLERDLVHPRDTARVEVVLDDPVARLRRADHADPAREARVLRRRALDQVAAAVEPLDAHVAVYHADVRMPHLGRPLAQERLERLHVGHRSLSAVSAASHQAP